MDKKRIEELTKHFLEEIGLDPKSKSLKRTPERVASMFEEIFSEIGKDPKRDINIFKTDIKDQVIILKGIPFFSFCEHHLLPFFGSANIAYIPQNGMITGFSSFVSIVRIISRRLQLQEKLTDKIADTILDILKPEGVMVIIKARHLCIEMRGEKPQGTEVTTFSVRGRMEEPSFKEKVISMMKD